MNKPTTENNRAKGTSPKGEAGAHKQNWDEQDEASAESFPASDAPTSWAGRDIPPQERNQQKKG